MKAKKSVAKAKRSSTRSTSATKPKRRPAAKKKTAKRKTAARRPATRRVVKREAAVGRVETPTLQPPAAAETKLTETLPKIAKPKTSRLKTVQRPPEVKLPPILLEGDFPSPPPLGGPGEKFALGPTPPAQDLGSESVELPEAYGTKRLFLTARDPHWLYAHWDLTREQQVRYNRQSVDGHLILRVYFAPPDGRLAGEVHVHPESRHWFAHVEGAGAAYVAEIGCYGKDRQWTSIARSGATLTPTEKTSDEAVVEFATIPVEVPFAQLLALVKSVVQTQEPLARAVEVLRRQAHPELPPMESPPPSPRVEWTPAQEQALAEVVNLDAERRVWIGSLEITELLRRELVQEISSQGAAQLSAPTSPAGAVAGVPGITGVSGVTGVSSPFGGEQARGKGFWFNVNAELIIYGATERDATVTIGGRTIKLRPDGSFSYRFALPDGRYDLPVVAVSADGTDGRAAELKFARSTELRGDVGATPQDPALKPPTPDEI